MEKIKAIYVTNDKIDSDFGGGPTIQTELKALRKIANVEIINPPSLPNPFNQDAWALDEYMVKYRGKGFSLVHSYAGSFTKLARQLMEDSVRYTATCCAHDVVVSKREHEKLQVPFSYNHLTDLGLFHAYTEHLRLAETVISPSTYSAGVLSKQGVRRVKIVPHSFDAPNKVKSLPSNITFGYIGSAGVDKGLVYLLAAWKRMDFGKLILAGKCCGFAENIIKENGLKNVFLMGELPHASDFYNSISCLVMPSATEGFGLPILEAMAHGRASLASVNAGGSDITPYKFKACDSEAIYDAMVEHSRRNLEEEGEKAKEIAKNYTVEKGIERYIAVWNNPYRTPPFFDYDKLKVHIGSFVNMSYYGWVNLDVLDLTDYAREHGYKFVHHDIREKLPFENNSVDLMFSHHCLEHLNWKECLNLLLECKRVMKPGAVFRVAVPSLEKMIAVYQAGDMDRYADNEGVSGCPYQSGKFFNLLTAGHQTTYDFAAMKWLADAVGLTVEERDYRVGHPQIIDETWENIDDSLFVEFKA